MTYRDSKNLSRRTASNKVLDGKAFDIAKSDRYQGTLSSMVYNFLLKIALHTKEQELILF